MTHSRRILAAVVIAATIVCPTNPAAAATSGFDVAAVQRQLDLLTTVDRMPGALAQVRGASTVTLTSGVADLGTGRPMVGANGRFRIASITKAFVATVVLQLVAAGKVRLDEPIETYLPGVVQGSGEGAEIDGREITVRQLLQHTSGVPNYTDHAALDELGPPMAPQELLDLALVHRPDFPPGTAWYYSNTGYIIAGMLIERVTGQDVTTAVTERVLQPVGLHHTYWPAAGDLGIRGQHARNYAENPAGAFVDVTAFEPSLAWAAGAMISTPTDLNRFWHALFSGRLLPSRVVAEMRTTVPLPPEWQELLGAKLHYGLGLMRIPMSCGGFAWGQFGGASGVSTISARDDRGSTATVYRTAEVQSGQPRLRTLHTVDIALCTSRR